MRRLLHVLAVSAMIASGARAAVDFAPPIDEVPLDEQVVLATAEGRLVMLVITQTDWCPPCIRLDRDLLRNPDETELAELTRDWTVIEIPGYDAHGDRALRDQGLRFQGTPTTLLIRPEPGKSKLRSGTLLGSVVGYPENYVDQLRGLARNGDTLDAAIQAARERGHPEDFLRLGNLYAARGQSQAATRTYHEILRLSADDVPGVDADSMAALHRQARWVSIRAQQRVAKDHKRVLHRMRDFEELYPDAAEDPEYQYVRAWSQLGDGRVDAGLSTVMDHFGSGEYDDVMTLAYLAFRNPQADVLDYAIGEVRKALTTYPDNEAALRGALGRLLRRHGQTRAAEAEFKRAMELTPPDDARYLTYQAQYEFMKRQ